MTVEQAVKTIREIVIGREWGTRYFELAEAIIAVGKWMREQLSGDENLLGASGDGDGEQVLACPCDAYGQLAELDEMLPGENLLSIDPPADSSLMAAWGPFKNLDGKLMKMILERALNLIEDETVRKVALLLLKLAFML